MEIAMLKTAVFLLLPLLGASAHMVAQNKENQRLIDLLKKTPVSDIEAGLPEESFDNWFGGLVKPAEIDYEVQECTGSDTGGTEDVQPVRCVIAFTKPSQPGWNRRIQVSFLVLAPPPKPDSRVTVKPLTPRLLRACEGPPNPRMKRPTHCYPKLSELQKLVGGTS